MIPEVSTIVLFSLLSCFTLYWGWKKGLFTLSTSEKLLCPISLLHVIAVFFIYFGVSNGITPLIGKIFQKYLFTRPDSVSLIELASWLNFLNFGLIFLGLVLYFFLLPKSLRISIWKERKEHSYRSDIKLGVLAWIISFAPVVLMNQVSDWFLIKFLGIAQLPEQLAVHFFKMTIGHPLSIFLTAFTIVIFAPLVEETLFRGFLQSFIRKHLGSKQAVFITSVLFAFFHFSPEQKLANLTIIASLFVFSLFLGLVYEKRNSLFAPMFLHATFNGINVLNLYFLGGIPGGPL